MDLEPISDAINPGDESSRYEAAFKIIQNREAIVKFALRGSGQPGNKQFQVGQLNYISSIVATYTAIEINVVSCCCFF